MLQKPGEGKTRRPSGYAGAATGADGKKATAITVGDFTLLVGKGKRAQRKVRQRMQRLQELAAAAEATPARQAGNDARDTANQGEQSEATAVGGAGSASMDVEPNLLQTMADDDLELALKAIGKAGLPGREDYLAEQQRRKEARLAAKPTWVKVKAVEAKWKKAQAKTIKAEATVKAATAAVEAAKAALAKAEAAVHEANRQLLEAQSEEAMAKAEVEGHTEPPAAPQASTTGLPGIRDLPAEYKQKPEVAAKLQQLDALLHEVLAGAKPAKAPETAASDRGNTREAAAAAVPAAAPRCGEARRSMAEGSSRKRALSHPPLQRDSLWEAARGDSRSRSPLRESEDNGPVRTHSSHAGAGTGPGPYARGAGEGTQDS